ncbi:MAG: M23 family metallopeptidase [Campylobacterota bacterium]|nr:M23 family metallopeptidase [Campylobacterota bacterium]
MMRALLLIASFIIGAYAIGPIATLATYSIKNGTVGLALLEKQNIKNAKLSYSDIKIDFYPHPNDDTLLYALIPVDFHAIAKRQKVNVSYTYNGRKMHSGFYFNIIQGNYPKEFLKVNKSKVKLSLKSQQRANKEYTKAIRLYKHHNPKLYWQNRFELPLKSKITSVFGTKRMFNGKVKSYHGGTDFRAKIGTPIIAANSGVVKLVKNRFYAGKSIIIDHGKGIYSSYYHLNTFKVKVGQKVKKGDIIGLSGATGRITGPHLHFGIRVHGVNVDPLQFVKTINSLDNLPLL